MNKKWFLMLTTILLSAMLSVGCAVDPDPAPPEDAIEDEGTVPNGDEETVPGVDENNTINQDDENDADRDPEDPIEDPEDINDANNKDE